MRIVDCAWFTHGIGFSLGVVHCSGVSMFFVFFSFVIGSLGMFFLFFCERDTTSNSGFNARDTVFRWACYVIIIRFIQQVCLN